MNTEREDLINKYRDINVDGRGWWEYIEGNLKEDLEDIGFDLDQMYFSGFWSQGDGACLTGRMGDWKKFCAKVPEFVKDFPNYAIYLQDEGANYKVEHHGHYYHENCTSHEFEDELQYGMDELGDDALDDMTPDGMMRYGIYKAALTEGDVGEWLKEHFKSLMRKLYRDLEAEYDYLTSDEAVWESIVANELNEGVENGVIA